MPTNFSAALRQPSPNALRDCRLVKVTLASDEKAYTELMRLYQESLYHVILKMVRNEVEAEDLTLETFGKAFRSLDKFSPPFAFSTWLFRIGTNNCIDFTRRQRVRAFFLRAPLTGSDDGALFLDLPDRSLNPQEAVIREERIRLMRTAVQGLPARYRQLVERRYFDERSYEELSIEYQKPLGTIKAQLHRARELLGQSLGHHGDSI